MENRWSGERVDRAAVMLRPVEDNAARWAEAQSVLDRTPTDTTTATMHRRGRFFVVMLVGLLVLGIGFGVVIGLLDPGHVRRSHTHVPVWEAVIGFAIALAGLALQGWKTVALWRSTPFRPAWRSPLVLLTRRQRKELSEEVRGRRPADPAHLPLSLFVAQRWVAQRDAVLANMGLVCMFLGLWIAEKQLFMLILGVAFGLFMAVIGPLVGRAERQARRFLDLYGLTADG